MKNLILIFVCSIVPWLHLSAQGDINFVLKDSASQKYSISEIDSISFIIKSDSLKLVFRDSLKAGGKDTIELKKVIKIEFTDSAAMAFHFKDTIIYRRITDIDSMVFVAPQTAASDAVRIGNLFWATKNLDVERYRNGDPIPEIKDAKTWDTTTAGAWCYYENNSINGAVYGKLYNWQAVADPRGLAPQGWRIPADAEWKAMIASAGGDSIAGGMLKEAGITHWQTPNTGADNSSGFTALPGGFRSFDGAFSLMGIYAAWWASSEYDAKFSRAFYITYDKAAALPFVGNKKCGMSVRCVKE